jgi:polyhydroxyalkanoate synthesis regulator phasin
VSSEATEFDVLHAVRIRGVAATDSIAEALDAQPEQVQSVIDTLMSGGDLLHREGRRVSGYVLTEDGKNRHASEIAAQVAGLQDALSHVYEQFLTLNGRIKGMCSAWQGIEDEVERLDAIDDLETFNSTAQVVFKRAGEIVPRFSRYGQGLAAALELLADGDHRYFTSPLVESYHTVWFEAHEDFLMCLGIDRAAEGSF